MFADNDSLEMEDLLLLEDFQIGYLPGWIPEREFAAVLHAYPTIRAFLTKKHPPIGGLVERVMSEHAPAQSERELSDCCGSVVHTIRDMLTYGRCPEVYDAAEFHKWDFAEITGICPLTDKIVIDAGAGTGRVALEAAGSARWVFAIEPVTRLRRFMHEKAQAAGLRNVFIIDGFLHAIPLPDHFADVLITSHALGWRLDDELPEFERVVKPGGFIIHCPGTPDHPSCNEVHEALTSPRWGYRFARFELPDGRKRKYWKQLG